MLLILNSCVSLEEIHNEKVEFVESIIQNPERCEEIIIESKFYKKGLTQFGKLACESLKRICKSTSYDELEIIVRIPNIKEYENNEVYIEIGYPDPRSRISFTFYSDGIYANKLKDVAILILGGY